MQATQALRAEELQVMVDKTAPDVMRQILETDMYALLTKQRTGASIFEQAGGYVPQMGIVGIIMAWRTC
ncbi:MAG: MotA/TolQ/ExbB proton channel family protein [Clostridia bacterium]